MVQSRSHISYYLLGFHSDVLSLICVNWKLGRLLICLLPSGIHTTRNGIHLPIGNRNALLNVLHIVFLLVYTRSDPVTFTSVTFRLCDAVDRRGLRDTIILLNSGQNTSHHSSHVQNDLDTVSNICLALRLISRNLSSYGIKISTKKLFHSYLMDNPPFSSLAFQSLIMQINSIAAGTRDADGTTGRRGNWQVSTNHTSDILM